jgi:TonB family protein
MVELDAVVLTDGTVGDVRVVKSLDREFGLDDQAMQAARRWVFRPPVDASGKPVRAVVTLILDFRLSKQAAPGVGPDSAQTPASPAAPHAIRDKPRPARRTSNSGRVRSRRARRA